MRVALVSVLALAIQAAPAHAAFPGQNGKIAYAASASGPPDIYVINPDGTGQTRLTTDPASDSLPAWSPDGREIAFTSTRDGQSDIYVMNADGTNVRRVTNFGAGWPSWSPDGTRLAFERNAEIWTVGADGSNPAFVTNGQLPDTCAVFASAPDWSPDGSYIAFGAYGNCFEGSYIALVRPDGSGKSIASSGIFVGIDWSPDGTRVAWADNEAVNIVNIYTHALSGVQKFADFPAWSPDGTRVAGRSGGEGSDYTANPDGTGVQSLSLPPYGTYSAFGGIDWQPILKGYPRPKGASPLHTSLVPAYPPCSAGTASKTHAPPLSFGSCGSPAPISSQLTVGTPDANSRSAKSIGFLDARVLGGNPATPADEADVALEASIQDVRQKSDLSDYTGQLEARIPLQVTDKQNTPYPGGAGPGTGQASTLTFTIPCTATADTTVGSDCAVLTSTDTLVPGTAAEGKRAIWQAGQVAVYDGGPDNLASTQGDNTLFEVQGVFVP